MTGEASSQSVKAEHHVRANSRWLRILGCSLLMTATCLSAAGVAAAVAPREYWAERDGSGGFRMCVDGVTSAEKASLITAISVGTESEVAHLGEGTWQVCWAGLNLSQMILVRHQAQQLQPSLADRDDAGAPPSGALYADVRYDVSYTDRGNSGYLQWSTPTPGYVFAGAIVDFADDNAVFAQTTTCGSGTCTLPVTSGYAGESAIVHMYIFNTSGAEVYSAASSVGTYESCG